ncbi:class I SAM-dependent methyltransferase [Candidatus Kuenenia sp.]|uniref:class I SAM-dependent methyltransferase n=1 Tax=Candidatus Kuenenia sp. TaxID=2499824 RepID=UPI0032200EE9
MSSSRKKHWENVYEQKKPSEVSWYQVNPAVSLDFITLAKPNNAAKIIDVGGGASVLVDELLDKGYRDLTILDISSRAIRYAQERLGKRAENVCWIEADVTEYIAPYPFDLWHDRAVFHFLTDPLDRKKYVEVLQNSLKRGGHLIIAAFAIDGPTRCSGLDIEQYDAEKLQNELGSEFLLMEEKQEIHVTPASKEQKFGFFRFMRK